MVIEAKGTTVSVLDDVHALERRVSARLKELRPLIDEYNELRRVAERLGIDVEAADGKRAPRRRAPAAGRRRAGSTRATGAKRRARIIELVETRPGISVPEISKEMGVDPPPLYRVVRKLQADGVVEKDGKGLRLVRSR